jgi:hypothetical protein
VNNHNRRARTRSRIRAPLVAAVRW